MSLLDSQLQAELTLLVFHRYTSVKADLEKAVVERDALHDALQETRTTLTDVRAQRDGLETDLKEARAAAKQLKKVCGRLPSSTTPH